MNPRAEALRILRSRIDWGEPLEAAFADPAVQDLSERDRRLLTEIVYGVLRHRSRLDFQIEALSSRPLRKVHPLVLWVLRIAVYQLSFLRTPPYAVVSHAVTQVRRIGQGNAAGFVNAVLRQFGRRAPALPEGETVPELALRYSHPEWLVERYCAREGPAAAEARLRSNNRPPAPIVWVNTFKTSLGEFLEALEEEEIRSREVPELPGALEVDAPAFVQHSLYRRGHCFFMDAASQRIARMCGTETGPVVELCAAPGNKSFVIAAGRSDGVLQVAVDISRSRLTTMAARARQYAVEGLNLVRADCTDPLPLAGRAEVVLLDVPCTGLGTVRANPDIRWSVQEEDLSRMAERQERMLRRALALVRRGGRVVYATCSSEPEENEHVVEAVIRSEPSATMEGQYFRSAEGRADSPGYFAATLRRQ